MTFGYSLECKGDLLEGEQDLHSCASVKRFLSKNNRALVLPEGTGLSFVFSIDLDL